MKKKGISVALVLVLALVMVLGSISAVEAKGNPNRNFAFDTELYLWDDPGSAYVEPRSVVNIEGYKTDGIIATWYRHDEEGWTYVEEANLPITIIPIAPGQILVDVCLGYTVVPTKDWRVEVRIANKSGNPKKKPMISSTAIWE